MLLTDTVVLFLKKWPICCYPEYNIFLYRKIIFVHTIFFFYQDFFKKKKTDVSVRVYAPEDSTGRFYLDNANQ